MKRLLWILLALALLAAAAPYLPAEILRAPVAAALERSLDRPVEIGSVHFTFFPAGPFPGPGFALENVTIHEDPRAGIEPFAHAREMGASIRMLSLLGGRFELAGVNFGDASVNLVKTADGLWNFRFLLEDVARRQSALPAIRMRGGRVNFKFGDTKSIFYFGDADLDIASAPGGAVDLSFGGAPARTDKSVQDFGRFFLRGRVSDETLDINVELERSALEEMLRLIDPRGFGVHGIVELSARLSGPPPALKITGDLQIGDIHRWDLLSAEGDRWQLAWTGTLDLNRERLELASADPQKHFTVRLAPGEASADFQDLPLATLFEIARHMGATLPENLAVDGSVSGTASYDRRNGLSGQLRLGEASLSLPEQEPVRAAAAYLAISGGAVRLAPAAVRIGEQTAQIDGIVTLAEPQTLDLTIRTQGLSVAATQSFGLRAIPVLEQTSQGRWRGWARYRETGWTGEFELRDAGLRLNGIVDPVEIKTASVRLRGTRVAVEQIEGKAGAAAFYASYHFDPAQKRPHAFDLTLEQADLAEIERLLAPSLAAISGKDQRSFLARTFRLGPAEPPAWFKWRRAEGSVRIAELAAGTAKMSGLRATFEWDGDQLMIAGTASGSAGGPAPEADFRSGMFSFVLQPPGADPRWKFTLEP